MAVKISLSIKKSARSLLYMAIGSVAVFVLFVVAPISYILAYNYYIPYNSVRVPLQLDFSVVRAGAYDTIKLYDSPEATFVVPENVDYDVKLKKNIDYTLSIEFNLPPDDYNKELGNFMVRTTWLDDIRPLFNRRKANRTVSHRWPLTSSFRYPDCISDRRVLRRTKPVILPYQSNLMTVLNTVLFYPCVVTGFCSEQSPVRVEMMKWSHGARSLPEFLVVEIDREVHINRAVAEWNVQWKGLRYFMHHYKITAFLFGSMFFWSVETFCMAVVSLVIVRMFGESEDSSTDGEANKGDRDVNPIKPNEDNIFAQRRKHLKSLIRQSQPAGRMQPTSEGENIDIHDPAGLLSDRSNDPSSSQDSQDVATEDGSNEDPLINEPKPGPGDPEDDDPETLKRSIPSSPIARDSVELTPTVDQSKKLEDPSEYIEKRAQQIPTIDPSTPLQAGSANESLNSPQPASTSPLKKQELSTEPSPQPYTATTETTNEPSTAQTLPTTPLEDKNLSSNV